MAVLLEVALVDFRTYNNCREARLHSCRHVCSSFRSAAQLLASNQATFALQRYPDLPVAMLMSPNKEQLQPRTRDFRTDMRLALSDCVTSPRCLTPAFHSLRHQLSLNALITSYTPSWAPQGSKTADMRVDEAARQTERTSLDMAERPSLSPGHQVG